MADIEREGSLILSWSCRSERTSKYANNSEKQQQNTKNNREKHNPICGADIKYPLAPVRSNQATSKANKAEQSASFLPQRTVWQRRRRLRRMGGKGR